MAYLVLDGRDREEMLAAIGAGDLGELFAQVPEGLLDPPMDLPRPLPEQELVEEVTGLAARNRPLTGYDAFLGAGVYHRFIPALVTATISRPEFYTTYTPYQAEASQGTLETIFEFQTMICELTGLDVANASLYDGATAAVEAAMLAVAHTGRRAVAVSGAVHPATLAVLATYCRGTGLRLDVVDGGRAVTSPEALAATVGEDHACLLLSQPSFLGAVEDVGGLTAIAHGAGALAVVIADPLACTVLTPPGRAGADVAVGDAQPLGIPPSFGGPHAGFMAVTSTLLRRLPGRIAGMTHDAAGNRAFTLTLQAREQHIRRERATSNICTNHALTALAASVYMALMGAGGMRSVAETSIRRAHHLADRLGSVAGFELAFPAVPFLWEFVLRCPGDAETIAAQLRAEGILPGLPLGRVSGDLSDCLLVCCTEMTAPSSIERFVEATRRLDGHRWRREAAV